MSVASRLVLIVDDCAEDRFTYKRGLEEDSVRDYVVMEAESGGDGLRLCREESPDCVVLDYSLPDVNGLEFLAEMSAGNEGPPIPVVMVTGKGDESVAVEAMKLGALDYLVKDRVSPNSLRRAVSNATDKARLRRQLKASLEREQDVSRQLRDALKKAETATEAKSQFLANMSHEIRTPMTAILGFTENLLDPDLPESERLNAVYTIRRNGDHLLQIINDILDLSKIKAGKLEIERLHCCPVQIVSDVQSLVQGHADDRKLVFTTEYVGAIPETIHTDPTRLKQILVNLIGNAIKFTETGSVHLVTHFLNSDPANGTRLDEPLLQFDVIDTGVGLTPEQMSKLFRPFMQADASTARKYGGSGLGLMISKHLARMLGGDITVQSKFGEGSTFRVTIATGPLDGVRMLDNPDEATVAKQQDAAETQPAAAPLDCHVLLAEDGPDNQHLISFVLRKAGVRVTIVENGQEAVDKVLGAMIGRRESDPPEPFDIILMDMQMPVMNGYEATGLLRQKGYTGPIIALTANAMASDRDKCIRVGCDDYATKPIDRKKIMEMIRKNLDAATVS